MSTIPPELSDYLDELQVPREAVIAALDEAVAFDGWDDPSAALAAARARVWRETGEWVSKREAEARA